MIKQYLQAIKHILVILLIWNFLLTLYTAALTISYIQHKHNTEWIMEHS